MKIRLPTLENIILCFTFFLIRHCKCRKHLKTYFLKNSILNFKFLRWLGHITMRVVFNKKIQNFALNNTPQICFHKILQLILKFSETTLLISKIQTFLFHHSWNILSSKLHSNCRSKKNLHRPTLELCINEEIKIKHFKGILVQVKKRDRIVTPQSR